MSEIFPPISSGSSQSNPGNRFDFDTIRLSNRSDTQDNSLNESWSSIITSFTVYKLLSEIVKPFTSMKAYQAGLIDANGNLLKREEELKGNEASILSPFVRLVIGIKRLVEALPSTRYKTDFNYIQTAARAMAFECIELGGNGDLFLEELEKSLDVLLEEGEAAAAPGNSIGGGFLNPQVGNPNSAIAGYSPPMGMARRVPVKKKIIKKEEIDT